MLVYVGGFATVEIRHRADCAIQLSPEVQEWEARGWRQYSVPEIRIIAAFEATYFLVEKLIGVIVSCHSFSAPAYTYIQNMLLPIGFRLWSPIFSPISFG